MVPSIRNLVMFAVAFSFSASLAAQVNGRLEGRVVREDGSGIGGVAVIINETGAVTLSEVDGHFVFASVPPGSYTLSFTVGDEASSAEVEIRGGETTTYDHGVDWEVSVFETITVYSASRRVERIVEAPAAITSISQEEMESVASYGQLPKVLEFTPGVEVTQNGLYDFNFNTRGFNSSLNRRVAVRIDGRDPAVGFLASQDWATTSSVMDDAASLEFMRGPSAALYGANAFNGVINIVTRAPRDFSGGMARLTGGELSTAKIDVNHSGGFGDSDWYYKVGAGYTESGDWTVSRNEQVEYAGLDLERIPLITEDNEIYYGNARLDGYFAGGNQALTVEGGTGHGAGPVVVTGIGRVQVTESDRPWARVNYGSTRFNLLGSYTGRDAPNQWSMRSGQPLFLDSKRLAFEAQGNVDFADQRGRFVGGVSYKEEDIDSANPQGVQTLMFEAQKADFSAVFGQLDFDITDNLKLVLAGRYDDGTLFDGRFSPKGALVWSVTPNNTVRVSYNEAFQVPNYSEFFLRAAVLPPLTALAPIEGAICTPFGVDCGLDSVPFLAVGNETLDVEEIQSYEVGYSGIIGGRAFLTVDYYFNDITNFITDLIPYISPPIGVINPNFGAYQAPSELPGPAQAALQATLQQALGPTYFILSNEKNGDPIFIPVTYTNFGQAETQGVDVGLNWYLTDRFSLDFSYAWFDFDVKQELEADPVLPNAPENRFSAGVSYKGDRWGGDLKYRWNEEFEWSAGVFRGPVPSYQLVDLGAYWDFNTTWGVGANVSNLLDETHYQIFGGDLIGRRALAYVRVGW